MKLSLKKQNELVVWEYFIPQNCQWSSKTNDDIQMFFEWSEQGKHKDVASIPTHHVKGRTYFHALTWGKKRAGIHIHELYEQGILDGTVPYYELIGNMPRQVVNFLKKEMFQGIDADVIEKYYEIYNQ